MRKFLIGMGLGFVGAALGAAQEAPATDAEPKAWIRVALIRDADSLERALGSVFQGRYDGYVRVVQNQKGRFAAINKLDVEDYLQGVVGGEISPDSPLEALKAQAIAARTHALFSAEQSLNEPFDLVANVSQAYHGKARSHAQVARAVGLTRNRVLAYRGALFPTFFHASCGGRTATMEEVWSGSPGRAGSPAMPRPVICAACAETTSFRWTADFTPSNLSNRIRASAPGVGDVMDVEVAGRTPSGRVSRLRVIGTGGVEMLSVEKLRSTIGYNFLRSGRFEIEKTAGGIQFHGDGWGHGVGLCQYGACRMARQGATCEEILRHYFPGATLVSYEPPASVASLQKH